MDERQDDRAGRAAAGTVADEAARLIEALGVWATSASAGGATPGATAAPSADDGPEGAAHGTGTPPYDDPGTPPYDDPGTPPYDDPGTPPHDDPGTAGGGARPDGSSRCAHCGAGTGVGQSISCQVCPICQGIALLRAVRPETVDRLADLAGALAATLRDVAASGRTAAGDHGRRPGSTAAAGHEPAWGAGGRRRTGYGPGHPGPRRRDHRRRRSSVSTTVGLDIGGTKINGCVVDSDGTIVARARRETPAQDADAIAHEAADLIRELSNDRDVVAAGVACAGFIDKSGATVLFAPNLAWRDEPLKQRLESIADIPVIIENDANAAAWGEFTHGVGPGHRRHGPHHRRHRHRRRCGRRRPAAAGRMGGRGRAGAPARGAGRHPLRVRQPWLLGAVRQRQRPRARGA